MTRRVAVLIAVVAVAGTVPATCAASTIVGSPLTLHNEGEIGVEGQTFIQTALPALPAANLTSPVDGTIVQWSLKGTKFAAKPNKFVLHVVRANASGEFVDESTSAVVETPNGSNDDVVRHFNTSLAIDAGDQLGLTPVEGTVGVPYVQTVGAFNVLVEPPFETGTLSGMPTEVPAYQPKEILVNAEVVAAPTSTATVPACSETGTVTVGVSTDPATAAKAVLFRVDEGAPQSAPATSGTATLTLPAGVHTLEYWAEDQVPQQERSHHSAKLQVGNCNPMLLGPPALALAPAVSHVSQTHPTWRTGSAKATISRRGRAPVGTTFALTLNEPATVSFAFARTATGRRVHGHCVARTTANARRPRCTRTATAGDLRLAARAGANRVRFDGVLASGHTLLPGVYTVAIVATTLGRHSTAHALTFTIVRR